MHRRKCKIEINGQPANSCIYIYMTLYSHKCRGSKHKMKENGQIDRQSENIPFRKIC